MQKIKQAVILAGGQGTRLRPLTLKTPKPLIEVHGKPFAHYLVDLLKENGISKIVFLTGYLGDQIENYFGDGEKFGLNITYSVSPIEFDTGARIREARELFDETFLLLYSDNYWPLNLKKLTTFYKKMGAPALVTVYKNEDSYTKNNMRVNEKGIVEMYVRNKRTDRLNGVDIGFFIIGKNILKNLPGENFSFEKVVMPRLIKQKQLSGFLTEHKYYGLSNRERIPLIKKYFKKRKVIFLDRDGVINKRPPKAEYVTKWEEFQLLPHALDALQLLTQKGFEIYIVSNQAGIGRGKMTEKDVQGIHKKILNLCKEKRINIKAIYYCPHDWNANCVCRKPKPGMFFQAAREHTFELTKAFFIGDDMRDRQAGIAAGCKTILMSPNSSLLQIVKFFI